MLLIVYYNIKQTSRITISDTKDNGKYHNSRVLHCSYFKILPENTKCLFSPPKSINIFK